jgi:hypothetical protein
MRDVLCFFQPLKYGDTHRARPQMCRHTWPKLPNLCPLAWKDYFNLF